jgi:hypothetical protein
LCKLVTQAAPWNCVRGNQTPSPCTQTPPPCRDARCLRQQQGHKACSSESNSIWRHNKERRVLAVCAHQSMHHVQSTVLLYALCISQLGSPCPTAVPHSHAAPQTAGNGQGCRCHLDHYACTCRRQDVRGYVMYVFDCFLWRAWQLGCTNGT